MATDTRTALAPNQTDTATFSCQEGTLVATADAKNDVRERDEENNVRSGGPFSCGAPPTTSPPITSPPTID
jgi:subtilase family serine protease